MIKSLCTLFLCLILTSCGGDSTDEKTNDGVLIYKVDVNSFSDCATAEPFCNAGEVCSQFPLFGEKCYTEGTLDEIVECSDGFTLGELTSYPSQIRCFEDFE